MDRRLNIGLMIDDPDNYFSGQACKGAELAAKAMDANLFIFPGHYIGKADGRYENREYEYQYNSVFTIPTVNTIDILFILLGTIGSRAELSLQMEFLSRLPKVPIVTLFANIPGYQSVTFDNRSGFSKALLHVINKHGAKKIGYVSGPETNRDALERLQAFRTTMADSGLQVEDRQIVFGDFTADSDDVVRKLLDDNADLEAVAFANDNMAIGGYRVFKERGLEPGKDIYVIGFDDDVFSASMNPPLTTVEASSADLTYKAVLSSRDFIERGKLNSFEVETFLVQRSSCGCKGLDIDDMRKRLHIDEIEQNGTRYVKSIEKYLFGIFEDDDTLRNIKDLLAGFESTLVDYFRSMCSEEKEFDTQRAFGYLIDTELFSYTSPEKLYNVLETLHSEASHIVSDGKALILAEQLFSEFYRKLSYAGNRMVGIRNNKIDRVSRSVSKETSDIFLMNNEKEIPFEHLLKGLRNIGFRRSYLYLFQGNVRNKGEEFWKCPNSVLLKALSDERGVTAPSDQQQLMRTEFMFSNELIDDSRRRTMVVSPLFVGEEIYGMLVNEIDVGDLEYISSIGHQYSVTLKSLIMIEEQDKVKKSLQNSLEQFMRDNSLLNEVAKSDELTGLYNRRGFLEYTQKAVGDPLNRGKKAIICYADMDNLKMVNDKFGHDDGDFALREIAAILKDTFRSGDIIGRLGGDEFVVFALVGVENYENSIKERLASITKQHNKKANKPYPIEMSTGICEFSCSADVDIYEVLDKADEKLYTEKTEKKAKYGSYR